MASFVIPAQAGISAAAAALRRGVKGEIPIFIGMTQS
jgi:hypothetical protein